ncbi:MAG: GGDEF domain-containing protein [Sphingopyxis sp.]|nr:GGDEF domain-containing protein [Sphingopyxis sp.]
MALPIVGFGAVFVGICLLVAREQGSGVLVILAVLGGLTTVLRLAALHAYRRGAPVGDFDGLIRWERRYAVGNYALAVLIALLNVAVISAHEPILHLLTVSLVFGFGAGIVSRIAVRPKVCVISLLLATLPTVAALALHAFEPHSNPVHTELFLVEAFIVAMITGLSLQTVAHLYHSAVEHHTGRHDMALLAKKDALTGLANRLSLRENFQARMAAAMRNDSQIAVHFLDLDGFKAINDRYGHPAGDAVLKEVARRLEAMVRGEDVIARLGGDEFVVVQADVLLDTEAELLARRIIREISKPYMAEDNELTISVSVGIAMAPKLGVELERLLACADGALYHAKAGGKARALFCVDGAEAAAA